MTARIHPPVVYRRWDGRPGRLTHADQLEAAWPWPTLDYHPATGRAVIDTGSYQDGQWRHAGWYPTPTGRRQWARTHWHHGRLLGIPRRHVAAFVVRALVRP